MASHSSFNLPQIILNSFYSRPVIFYFRSDTDWLLKYGPLHFFFSWWRSGNFSSKNRVRKFSILIKVLQDEPWGRVTARELYTIQPRNLQTFIALFIQLSNCSLCSLNFFSECRGEIIASNVKKKSEFTATSSWQQWQPNSAFCLIRVIISLASADKMW